MLAKTRCVGVAALLIIIMGMSASADEILVASVTCIPEIATTPACLDAAPGELGRWRVLNWLVVRETPGDSELLDVSFTVETASGSTNWTWDRIDVPFLETELFDLALVRMITSMSLEATLPRTEFDPAFPLTPYLKFIADSATLSVSATAFPPPLDLLAQGTFITTVPEPDAIALFSGGFLGVLFLRRFRSSFIGPG